MKSKNLESIEEIAVIVVDIGKDTFHLVGFDDVGHSPEGRRQPKHDIRSAAATGGPSYRLGGKPSFAAYANAS